ncbi:MAG TPA: hypothetical protein VG826_25850 [Pirellulales bacterium]|nr:hypothetical protein [Pirellulales bacterium]
MSRRFQFSLDRLLLRDGPQHDCPKYVIKWRQRRAQFTLQSLLAAMLIASGIAAIAHYDRRAHQEQVEQARATLKRCEERERQLTAAWEESGLEPGELREAIRIRREAEILLRAYPITPAVRRAMIAN